MASTQPRHFRIFLASPGDVAAERSLVMKVVEDLQYEPSLRGKVTLEIVAWEKKGAPPLEAGIPPQEAISQGLPQPCDCDIVVVVFWSRMGTPFELDGRTYQSGTHYEYENAMAAFREHGSPRVLVYRRTEEPVISLAASDFDKKRNQFLLVKKFFEQNFVNADTSSVTGGYNQYATPEAFAELFEDNLKNLLERLLQDQSGADAPPSVTAQLPELWQGSPFPGLRAFKAEDAPIYFGRGRETDALTRRVQEQNFVAVVGASGSGKSSLVGAGLIPLLRSTLGEGRLLEIIFTPDEHGVGNPFGPLAAALRDLPGLHKRKLAPQLHETPELLPKLIEQALNHMPDGAQALLFIDQFEELFTTVEAKFRQPFINMLVCTVRQERIRTVVTLRGDFYGYAITYSELAELLEEGTFPLSAPGIVALHEMIARPAARAGLTFEDDLAQQILDDTGIEPGSVALMAYALDELYRLCGKTGTLTDKAYKELGGVQGAIGRRSELIYAGLDTSAQEAMPSVFRELVSVEIDGTATRQRAFLSSIQPDEAARKFIEAFTDARLLVQGRDADNKPYIEVAHEALLISWDRLATWIDATQDDLRLLRRIRQAAHEWDAIGQPEDYPFFWPHELLIQVEVARKRWQVTFDEVTALFARPEAERLVAYLNSDSNISRNFIYQRLRRIGKAAIPVLIEMLENSDSTIRQSAVEILVFIDSEQALDVLIKMLNDPAIGVRYAAIEALGQIKSERALNPLAEMLNDPIAKVRGLAIEALERIKSEDAISYLIIALNDSSERVRRKAAAALGTIGSLKGETPLIERLTDPAESVRRNAAKSLVEIESIAGIYKLVGMLKAASKKDRRIAMEALSTMKSTECVGILELALADSADLVRQTIIQVLGKIGSERAIKTIISSLNDPSETVRQACAKALRVTNSVQAIDGLKVLLNDPIELVRQTSIETLEAINTPEALEVLAKWGHR